MSRGLGDVYKRQGEAGFRLDTDDAQDLEVGRRGRLGVVHQCRLPDAGFTPQDENPAQTLARIGQQPVYRCSLHRAAVQIHGQIMARTTRPDRFQIRGNLRSSPEFAHSR